MPRELIALCSFDFSGKSTIATASSFLAQPISSGGSPAGEGIT